VYPHPRFVRCAVRWLVPWCVGIASACADASSRDPAERVRAAAGSARASVAAPADTDDFGAPIPTDASARARVVSLNPAATEVIFAIGAQATLVGRSRWDEFPAAAANVASLGDGIRPNVEAVLAAKPTLVVLYATPDNRAAAQSFARAGVRTIAVRVDRMAQFHALVRTLGVALGAEAQARVVNDSVAATVERVRGTVARLVPPGARKRVVWPAWSSPPIVIGGGSYLDELLSVSGADNVFHDTAEPSRTVSAEEIIRRAPAYVVTSETTAKTLASATGWRAVPAVQAKRFILADPAVTGRPSVVLGMAAVQLARALHPTIADSIR